MSWACGLGQRLGLGKPGQGCTVPELCPACSNGQPQSGTHCCLQTWETTQKCLEWGLFHPIYAIPAEPSKKGSCKGVSSCLFEGNEEFLLTWPWHFVWPLCWVFRWPQ